MAKEATRRSDQVKYFDAPENIMILEKEIDQARRDASQTIQELKFKVSEFARAEIRDKAMKVLSKTEKTAEKAAETVRRQALHLKEGLRKVDKKTAFYAVGGILAAGSLFSILVGRRRQTEERAGFDLESAESILEEARRESVQAGREQVIVTPAEHYHQEAASGFRGSPSSRPLEEKDVFQELETEESSFEEERKKTI